MVMYKILKKKFLTPAICLMDVEAPRIAHSARPGQFLIVRAGEKSERIPLTICDYDTEKGSVTIVTQEVGASTKKICHYEEGESFADVVGPLGQPSEGAYVDVIIGARNKDLIIMEDEMKAVCDHLYICTDDGSAGEKGVVTAVMDRLLGGGEKYDQAVSIGPMIMMKFATLKAKEYGLPLIVSLNTLMVDGTGMCGACRVTIAGKTKFACVDGPEFNAYDVDFEEAMRRQGMYRDIEREEDHKCNIGLH